MVERTTESLDKVFGALADPTRRAILNELGRRPARVTEIAQKFPVSLNAVSKHLLVLEKAGLVHREIRGREHFCSLQIQRLRQASTWIETMRGFWEERLDELERYLVAKKRPH
jgi:DNA-binding transcriptional ArsR family regulator